MSRKLKIGAVQMDATPAPTPDRLARAEGLVAEAAASGAQVVVLPECFNTGYAYIDSNFAAAEPLEGQTVTWMRAQAKQHDIHLLGSIMLCDGDDVYNSALLFAPDGRMWRYDKNYPFNWERVYFREGNQTTIADTDLGKFGLMICWDSAHGKLWQQYAGKVDAVLIPSCPPRFETSEVVFDDGKKAKMWLHSDHFADKDLHDQAAWLKVPVVHSSGNGRFRSQLPLSRLSLLGILATSPSKWLNILLKGNAYLEADYGHTTQIIDKNGEVVGRVTIKEDGFTLAEVELGEESTRPDTAQPKMRTARLAYLFNDIMAPPLFKPLYRRGLRARSNC